MSKIEIPAKVLRAAALFASKDEARRILCGVRVMWNADGDWEVNATDSFRLFEAWGAFQINQPEGALVFDAAEVGAALKASDEAVELDTETGELAVHGRKGTSRVLVLPQIEGTYPNVHQLLDWDTETEPGHPGAFNAEYLQSFCKVATVLTRKKSARVMRLSTRCGVPEDAQMRAAVIDWPGLGNAESFWARGILMPVRL